MSAQAAKTVRQTIREWRMASTRNNQRLEDLARVVNPVVRGWMNYYGRFKTLKYCPAFPERFGALEDARAFGQRFFAWYNDEHHHSGLGYLTPAMVHYGWAEGIRDQRQTVLAAVRPSNVTHHQRRA